MGSKTSGRKGGNPEFGKTIKPKFIADQPLDRILNVRLTASIDDALKELGDRRMEFVREAIAEKLQRESQHQ